MTYVAITKNTEIFTFKEGMINNVNSTINTDIEQNIMPSLGPASNQGYDFNGCNKVITITGQLFDTTSTVSSTQNIRDKKIMKYWLEALQDGAQEATTFISNYEEYSVEGSGTTNMTDSVSGETIVLPASFATTKVYKSKVTFDDESGNPELIPFTLDLWVAAI